MDDIIKKAMAIALKELGSDKFYGLPYTERVKEKALTLAEKFGVKESTLVLASYFHTISQKDKQLSLITIPNKSSLLLKKIGCDDKLRIQVTKIILLSDPNNWDVTKRPKTIEEKIFYDAKTSEDISSIGIIKKIISLNEQDTQDSDIIPSIESFIREKYSSLFFDKTKNMIEYDYRMVTEFIANAKKQGDVL
ncbi:MAG: hypothetical protein K0B07_04450 [DPANN group archaeon]|nr:hypothetical protein [DPANN group archaeon]